MEYRPLGASGLQLPVLSFGTAAFGNGTDLSQACRLLNLCLEAGITFFDTANVYSHGLAEEMLGKALTGHRHEVLLSTKATFPMGAGPNDYGSSRRHLLKACEDSLRRLGTDYLDVFHLHGFDAHTPVPETLRALDDLVASGKVRYLACSNFSGWHLMKSLSVSERHGWARYVGHQVHYSLLSREYEWELLPLGEDQGVGALIWSPLASGRLSGKIRRGHPAPPSSGLAQEGPQEAPTQQEQLFRIVDMLEQVAVETEKTVAQVALNWLLQRPTVTTLVFGARNEAHLRQNLGAVGWNLSTDQMARLSAVSATPLIYPYWHQRTFPMLQKSSLA